MTRAPAWLLAALVGAGVVAAAQDRGSPAQDYALPQNLWTDTGGRPTLLAFDALGVIDNAAADGLDAADYGARALRDRADALAESRTPSQSSEFDDALGRSLIHFLLDLHRGRVEPKAAGFVALRRDDGTVVDALRRAIQHNQLTTIAREVAPQSAAYAALREQLKRYRRIAADTPGADARTTLIALGDLRAMAPDAAGGDAALAEALRQFQRRHGLKESGVVDTATRAALNVPLALRVHQIELSLERLRWLPEFPDGPIVIVNIPAFRLWAWDGVESGGPALSMRVIVGRASTGRTPAFTSTIESVIIRPFWNVPASIARAEILPRLARDPAYLERERMDVVKGPNVVPATADSLAMVRRGDARIRQRPGAANALGLLKIVFPNDGGVYIHGTPSPQLFNQTRRDLSHGCMRAEDPIGLAAWLLNTSEWSRDRLTVATEGSETRTVDLTRGVPVVVFYTTAFVGPDDGLMYFVPDIYRYDSRLDALLDRRDRWELRTPREIPHH